MANKRIIDLTASAGLNLTDVFEIDTGVASFKVTGQQIYDFIHNLLNTAAPLSLGGGTVLINQNSNIQLSNLLVGGNLGLLSAPTWAIDAAGSGNFAGGLIAWGATGSMTFQGDNLIFQTNTIGPVLTSSPGNVQWKIVVSDLGALSTVAP